MAAPPASPIPPLLQRMCLVLVRTQGPVNLGMIARLCSNFGIADLRLVAPMCEVNCPESRMFSTHAKDQLLASPVFADLGAATADCGLVVGTSARVRDAVLGDPMPPAALAGEIVARGATRWALVLGNEADGLAAEELARCQLLVRIETFGANYSYNLSHAAAILLYQLAIAGGGAAPLPEPNEELAPAPREHVEQLYDFWLHTLSRFDYFRRTDRDRFGPQLQRFINRMPLTAHDVQMLWGMLAQFHRRTFGDRGRPDTGG